MPNMTSDETIQEASRILKQQATALLDCSERLKRNGDEYHKALYHIFRACNQGGKIIVTGMGKSGKVGEKLVATFQSTGSNAIFLHPTEAFHGDFGIVQTRDTVLAISHSGNTEEVLRIIPLLRSRGVSIIALCGAKHSQLVKEADAWLDAYVKNESCSYIPAPTTSTTVAMAVGDSVAITLMKLRGFTSHHFAMNHPGGTLGRQLLMKVRDVMYQASEIAIVDINASMDQVISESTRFKCGTVLVMDNSDALNRKVTGLITKANIRRALSKYRAELFTLCAGELMTSNFVTCSQDDMAVEVKRLMEEPGDEGCGGMPVLDKGSRLQGLILYEDLVELL